MHVQNQNKQILSLQAKRRNTDLWTSSSQRLNLSHTLQWKQSKILESEGPSSQSDYEENLFGVDYSDMYLLSFL